MMDQSCTGRWSTAVGRTAGLGLACGLLLVAGCVRYQPAPIDPLALADTWQRIDPGSATDLLRESLAIREPAIVTGFDLADGISLAEAEATALFFNPAIRVTRLQLGVPEAAVDHARLWEDPELAVDGDYILADVDDPLVIGAGIGITIPLSGRLGAARRLAQAEADAAVAAIRGAEWALLDRLRRTWLQLAAAVEREEALRRSLDEIDGLLGLMPELRRAQAVTVVDERLLRIQRLRLHDQQLQATSRTRRLRQELCVLLGLHPEPAWRFTADLADLADLATTGSPGISLPGHPQLQETMAAYQVAERQLALEVRRQYPDLRIGFGAGVEEGESRILFGLGLLPLPVWNRNRGGIAGATAGRAVAGAELSGVVQDLLSQLAVAQADQEAAEGRLALLREELVPLVDQQIADARRLVGLGELDLFLLADALEQARDLRLDLLTAQEDVLAAGLQLRALAGPPADQPADDPMGADHVLE